MLEIFLIFFPSPKRTNHFEPIAEGRCSRGLQTAEKAARLTHLLSSTICYFCDYTDANARERLTRESVRGPLE